MIEMPKRNVTRFFIPLVDIMMLMFSLFLLMPIMEAGSVATVDPNSMSAAQKRQEILSLRRRIKVYDKISASNKSLAEKLREANRELRRIKPLAAPKIELDKLRAQVAKLRMELKKYLKESLFIRILEIEAKDKQFNLVYFEPGPPPRRYELKTKADALELIRKDKLRPEAKNRELYYLVRFPTVDRVPPKSKTDEYARWFESVTMEFN